MLNNRYSRAPSIDEAQLAAALNAVFDKSDVIHGALAYERADGHYLAGEPSASAPSNISSMSLHLTQRNQHPGLLLGKKRFTPMSISVSDPEIADYGEVQEFADNLAKEKYKTSVCIPIRDHSGRLFVSGIASRTRKLEDIELRMIQAYCLDALESVVKEIEPGLPENSLLTARERQCLILAAKGYTEKRTARILSISPFTVHAHIQSAKNKLGARTKLDTILKGLHLSEIMPADSDWI